MRSHPRDERTSGSLRPRWRRAVTQERPEPRRRPAGVADAHQLEYRLDRHNEACCAEQEGQRSKARRVAKLPAVGDSRRDRDGSPDAESPRRRPASCGDCARSAIAPPPTPQRATSQIHAADRQRRDARPARSGPCGPVQSTPLASALPVATGEHLVGRSRRPAANVAGEPRAASSATARILRSASCGVSPCPTSRPLTPDESRRSGFLRWKSAASRPVGVVVGIAILSRSKTRLNSAPRPGPTSKSSRSGRRCAPSTARSAARRPRGGVAAEQRHRHERVASASASSGASTRACPTGLT